MGGSEVVEVWASGEVRAGSGQAKGGPVPSPLEALAEGLAARWTVRSEVGSRLAHCSGNRGSWLPCPHQVCSPVPAVELPDTPPDLPLSEQVGHEKA